MMVPFGDGGGVRTASPSAEQEEKLTIMKMMEHFEEVDGPFNHEFAKFRFHFGVGNNIRPGQKMDTPGSVAVDGGPRRLL